MPQTHILTLTASVGCHYTEEATGWHWSTITGPAMSCSDCGRPFTRGYSATAPGTYETRYYCGCTVRLATAGSEEAAAMSEQDGIDRLRTLQDKAFTAQIEGSITGIMSDLPRQIHEIRRLNEEHNRRLAAHGWRPEQRPRTPEQQAHMRWYRTCYHAIYAGTLARWEEAEEEGTSHE